MAGAAAVQGLVRGICLQAGGVLAPKAAAVVQGLRVDRFAGGQGHGGLGGDDGAAVVADNVAVVLISSQWASSPLSSPIFISSFRIEAVWREGEPLEIKDMIIQFFQV